MPDGRSGQVTGRIKTMNSASPLGSKVLAAARSTGTRLRQGPAVLRLVLAGGALLVVLAVLAFGLMRLVGPRQ